jgi:uncharacterized membrane protein
MNTLISLLFSYYILLIIGIITGLYFFKKAYDSLFKTDLDYKKIAIWFYNTVKSIFGVWKR